MGWSIRKAKASDWPRIREICWQTSSLGENMPIWRREVFSEVWVGPYQAELPDWTWVATPEDSPSPLVAGYITVAPDTRALHKTLAWKLRPRACRAALKSWRRTPLTHERLIPVDLKRHFLRSLGWEQSPEAAFGADFLQSLLSSYPAHLHINFAPAWQGQGGGTPLIRAALGALGDAGIVGTHLFCDEAPLRFYEKNGFRPLKEVRWGKEQLPVFCLGWNQAT